ncbi:MAG: hydroxyacid dehydrogenase [Deltaproteobacteria bacterium]|nr:hydroxyacid dehydrogenase [Deltaproteobacteria bacterium]
MKILMASSIDHAAIEALERSHDVLRAFNGTEEQLCSVIDDREALIFRSGVQISATVMDRAPQLRLLVRAGSGLDNVDVEHATRRGIRIVRVPGSSAQPVAEFTFALLLSLVRQVSLGDRLLRQGHWPKAQLGGPLVTGKTLGIVGVGNIGRRVGELAVAWGMRAIGCVAVPSDAISTALAARGIELTDFETVVSQADFLCLHVPLDHVTHHMVDARVLSHMKQGSYLINVARGGVVDEKALYAELVEGSKLRGAAIDVHESEGEGSISPFGELPNVVLTPHIGAMALDAQRLIGARVVALVAAHQQGELEKTLRPDELVQQEMTINEGEL